MLDRFTNFLTILITSLLAISLFCAFALAEEEDDNGPEHSLGSGDSDWWPTYPDKNIDSGSAVNHPDWVIEALEDRPLLILIHQNNCLPCVTHVPRINDAIKIHNDDIRFYSILAEGDGILKAMEVLDIYSPTGKKQYVPTTIFLTLIENEDGEVEVGWHSEIDIMSTDDINSYADDSIYYHQQNAADWEQ